MVNNDFPQIEIYNIIKSKLQNLQPNPQQKIDNNEFNFYVQLQDVKYFKSNSNALKSIIYDHVEPTDTNRKIKLVPFFKPNKLSSAF